jgi:hypothetical protein
MPTNGFADGILYTVNGAPVFTYGMITLTAVVLAYVTFIEAPDMPIESNPIAEVVPQIGVPLLPEVPTIPLQEQSEEPAAPAPFENLASPEPPSPEPPSPEPKEEATAPQVPPESEEKKAQGGKKIKKRKTRRLR